MASDGSSSDELVVEPVRRPYRSRALMMRAINAPDVLEEEAAAAATRRTRGGRRKATTTNRAVRLRRATGPGPAAPVVVPPPPPPPVQRQPLTCHIPCRPPDVVMATGQGPRGRTVLGFAATASGPAVAAPQGSLDVVDIDHAVANYIICTCHGATFSPVGFLAHAGATDVANPSLQILAFPWLKQPTTFGPPGNFTGPPQ
ncbi:hypothetical protein GUJ93_ZPchr0007g5022 [Zizania palustris]|uniref:Ninja-family protein n=1 Tax=Zizania palustris TaxID=103762 RepID=A0A8J5VYH5_ZIZPA|nr:hypothetical protein GUJ93_ZPchr0007g5022 [Zizania palustris]